MSRPAGPPRWENVHDAAITDYLGFVGCRHIRCCRWAFHRYYQRTELIVLAAFYDACGERIAKLIYQLPFKILIKPSDSATPSLSWSIWHCPIARGHASFLTAIFRKVYSAATCLICDAMGNLFIMGYNYQFVVLYWRLASFDSRVRSQSVAWSKVCLHACMACRLVCMRRLHLDVYTQLWCCFFFYTKTSTKCPAGWSQTEWLLQSNPDKAEVLWCATNQRPHHPPTTHCQLTRL